METFSINDPADRERCGVDSLDLNSFVTERRRTGTDRSRPGIPADDYTPGAFFQADSSTGLPSTSQGSTWETVSGTSHSQDFSLVDGVQDESIPAESQSLHGRALPPDITFTEPPLQSAHDAGSRFDQWNRPQMGGDQAQIFPHLQPASTGSLDFGPGTPISDISRSVSSLMVDTIFQQPPPNVQAYFTPDMFMFPAFDLLSGFQTSGRSSSIGCLPDDSGQLGFSDTGESTSASDSVSPSSANRRYESYAGPVHRHDDSHLTITTPSHTLKRKRSSPSSPPTRTNLDKINGVRERHACIRCRFLHEEVCQLELYPDRWLTNDALKCDVNEICSNCVKVHLTGKIWKNQPCFRGTLSSVKVHRYGRYKSIVRSHILTNVYSCTELSGRHSKTEIEKGRQIAIIVPCWSCRHVRTPWVTTTIASRLSSVSRNREDLFPQELDKGEPKDHPETTSLRHVTEPDGSA